MMDRFMDKLMETAASAYLPKLQAISNERKAELEEMKKNVRANPEQVEAWFEKEIEKLRNLDVSDTLNKVLHSDR